MRLCQGQRIATTKTSLGQDNGQRCASVHSVHDCVFTSSNCHCPILDAHRATAISKLSVIASVVLLFLHGCPATIHRRVSFAIVAAIDCVLRAWRRSHILKKVLEAVSPAGTYTDAFGPIFWIARALRTITAGDHICPNVVDARLAHTMCRIAFNADLALLIFVPATARCRCPLGERLSGDDMSVPA